MDPRRLELLLELSRQGSMHAVADTFGVTTSTVSQQIAALSRDVGTPLIEPDGRRVRLTPAGRRLVEHAVTILGAIEAARADLDPDAEPVGVVRVAAFATAVRQALLPIVASLAQTQSGVRLRVLEHEPAEALALLAADDIDLALTYDYNLSPVRLDRSFVTTPLGTTAWGLGVPSGSRRVRPTSSRAASPVRSPALDVFDRYRDRDWIVNSRNTADEDVVRIVASLAGFHPTITHRADSLELVQDMVLAGLGVGLLPVRQRAKRGVSVLSLRDPDVQLRAFAVTRRGRDSWPPLVVVLRHLAGVTLT